MRITKIEDQKKNIKRCSIYIDGEYHSSIDKDVLEELRLSEGMELDEDEFNQKLEIIEYKSTLKAALYILMRSSKSEYDIRNKLKEKHHSDKAIEQVMKYLREIKYVNDESYTESYIRSLKDTAGASRRSIYYKLAGKGVDNEIIQQKLEEAEIDDYASALAAAKKKLSGLKGDKREKTSKLLNFLFRKGYGMEICRKVIEALDLEEFENS